MEITQDFIQTQIPYYLTQDEKINLAKALRDFPVGMKYYTQLYPNQHLQGDGWSSLEIISLENGERKFIKGILLSNSCDIDSSNLRDVPPNLCFAPIIQLDKYLELLRKSGLDKEKISNKAKTIKEQKVSTLFYLPSGEKLNNESIALLDDIHTIPLSRFMIQPKKEKLFTLSQAGFYLFLLKISVHFCRFHEKLSRN